MSPELFCEMLDDLLERGWMVSFDKSINVWIASAAIGSYAIEQASSAGRCEALYRVKLKIDEYQDGIDRAAGEDPHA
jgi:hypothetical protein